MQHIIDRASILTDRIAQVEPGSFDTGERSDVDVIRRCATILALFGGYEDLQYVDHNHDTPHEAEHGTIVLGYTDSVLILIRIKDEIARWVVTKTDVIPRTSLTAIDVKSVATAIGARADQWPTQLQVGLTYADEVPELTLPLHLAGLASTERRQELAVLVPGLSDDLNART